MVILTYSLRLGSSPTCSMIFRRLTISYWCSKWSIFERVNGIWSLAVRFHESSLPPSSTTVFRKVRCVRRRPTEAAESAQSEPMTETHLWYYRHRWRGYGEEKAARLFLYCGCHGLTGPSTPTDLIIVWNESICWNFVLIREVPSCTITEVR